MAKKPESRRQRNIRAKLTERYGGKWFKVHGGPFQESGLPDLNGCLGFVHRRSYGYPLGLYFVFEVKEPDGEPTAIQLEQLAEYRANGATAELVETPEEAFAAVDRTIAEAEARGLVLLDPRWQRLVLRARGRKDLDTARGPRTKRRRNRPLHRPPNQ